MEFADFPKGGMDRPRQDRPSFWEKVKRAGLAELTFILFVILLAGGAMAAWYESASHYPPR